MISFTIFIVFITNNLINCFLKYNKSIYVHDQEHLNMISAELKVISNNARILIYLIALENSPISIFQIFILLVKFR